MPKNPSMLVIVASLFALGLAEPARGEDIHVAVAANFAPPMKAIAAAFERSTGHKAVLAFGSTGKFYAQIKNGAPFDVFLAADAATPAQLERANAAHPGSRFTYAIGKLVLWSAKPDFVDNRGEVLRRGSFNHIALAAPKLAPYGAAAVEVLENLGLMDALRSKFVQGENIAQAYQFVATGNADLGFVALSQVYRDGKLTAGSGWIIPANLHTPIRQDAVILSRAGNNPAALALAEFLKGEKARAIVMSHGYDY